MRSRIHTGVTLHTHAGVALPTHTYIKVQPGGAPPTHTNSSSALWCHSFSVMPEALIGEGNQRTTVHLVSETWRGHLPFFVQLICVSIPLWLQCKQVQALLSTDFCRTTHRQSNPTAGKMHVWRTGAANAPRLAETKTQPHRHNFHPASVQVRLERSSCWEVKLFRV